MLPSYYGVRRPFISDSDLSNKSFPPDVYSSPLGGKALSCESAAVGGYPPLIDSYYPDTFGDYRSAAAFSAPGGSFLPSAALSSLLPGYGGESSHLFLVGGVRLGRGEAEKGALTAVAFLLVASVLFWSSRGTRGTSRSRSRSLRRSLCAPTVWPPCHPPWPVRTPPGARPSTARPAAPPP